MTNTPKSEETKRKLIDAAGQVFSEVGYETATVRQITDRAEANVAAVNYYFGDKRELYRTVLQSVTSRLVVQLRESCTGSTPEVRLTQFVRAILIAKSLDDQPWAPLLMAREVTELSEQQVGFIVEAVRPLHLLAEQIVRDLSTGGDSGQIHLAASLLVALCVNRPKQQRLDLLLASDFPFANDLEASAEQIARFALAGIRGMCNPQP
jgi:AcrR family transcriptional regulator